MHSASVTPENDESHRVLITPERLVGQTIDGRYRLDSILGAGGMGVVYRTHQANLSRDVAIKLLKIDDPNDRHRAERFEREIAIVSKLSHPNIVRVFDSGRDERLGLSYVVMELVEGVTLEELLRGHRFAPILAIDIAHEICAALTEPHAQEVVHRDIKPANVLISIRSDDTVGVKVVDFGIARGTAGGGSSKITTTGVVVGSPMYMAPEVARGESLDARTDLYSVGVVLYEMLTGITPFRGSTPVAIMLRQAAEDPPSLAEEMTGDFQYPELVELVDSLLSKDRRHRPQDSRKVLRRLDGIRTKYNIGRVRVDGAKSPFEALVAHRVRTKKAESLAEESAPASDSFSGWLLPEEAGRALSRGVSSATSFADTLDDGAAVRRPTTGLVAGGLALVVALGLGAFALADDDPVEPAVELGDVPSVVVPDALRYDDPPAQETEVATTSPVADADAGADPADGGSKPTASATDRGPAPPPAKKDAAKPSPDPPAEKPKVDNLDWIRRK